MDDFPQSAAPSGRRRRPTSSRRLLGLLVVLALVLALPGRALADRVGTVSLQPLNVGATLAYDTTSDEMPPSEPAPADPTAESGDPAPPSSSDPAPSDPAPPPSDPQPTPSEPAPAPSEPAPSEPAPAPAEPTPSEPAPAPSDPVPPADEVPVDPAPAQTEPAPSDPAPRDGRVAKPPPSEEREVTTTAPSAMAPLALSSTAPSTSESADPTTDVAKSRDGTDGQRQAKVVRAAFRRLGLGTIAGPAAPGEGPSATSALAQACTPIGTVAVTDGPQGATGLASRADSHPRRVEDDAPMVRGPPAPLQSPSSPIATAGAASSGPGGASSDRDCAILADQIVFTLAERGCATASTCCDHVAPAPANAAARAPPVV